MHLFVIYMDVFSIGGVERLCVDYGHALKDCGHECVIIPMRLSCLGDRIDCDFLIEDYDFTVSADQELHRIIASFDQAPSRVSFIFNMKRSTEYLQRNIDTFERVGSSAVLIHNELSYSYAIYRRFYEGQKIRRLLQPWHWPRIISKSNRRLRMLRSLESRIKILTVSNLLKKHCLSFGLRSTGLVPNGINVPRLIDLSTASDQALDLPPSYVVSVARLSSQKRHDLLLRAYAASKTDLSLVFVGDGPFRYKLNDLAVHLGISDRVFFMGATTNPYPILKNAKFSIVCSEYEGFGLTVGESLCLGVPVLITDRGYGIHSLIGDCSALFVCEDKVSALAESINRLSLLDEGDRETELGPIRDALALRVEQLVEVLDRCE